MMKNEEKCEDADKNGEKRQDVDGEKGGVEQVWMWPQKPADRSLLSSRQGGNSLKVDSQGGAHICKNLLGHFVIAIQREEWCSSCYKVISQRVGNHGIYHVCKRTAD